MNDCIANAIRDSLTNPLQWQATLLWHLIKEGLGRFQRFLGSDITINDLISVYGYYFIVITD